MCGIAGIFHFNSDKKVDIDVLLRMREILAHRGPDGAGAVIYGNVGLAHRRLSIIDLTTEASQPFVSQNGRFTIVYNGEIFNYLELKPLVVSRGYKLRTKSDTEILLCLYEIYGETMLEKLNGMFSFAIYDKLDKSLYVARDRIGIKPFYYSLNNETLYFASEPKAILATGISSFINQLGIEELLLFRYIAGENTIYQNIKRLLPGHSLKIEYGKKPVIKRWWNLSEKILINRENLPKDPFQWFEEVFYSSVKYRTISDVPIGIMLSGGLDSGSIAAALSHNGEENLSAFTVAFNEVDYNEGHLASKVASKFGLNYHEIRLKDQDLIRSLKEAAWYHDEPLVHQNDAQMLALAKYSKKFVSVLLSGEGGDEFMGGYVRYKPLNYSELIRVAGFFSGFIKPFIKGGIVNRFDKLNRYSANGNIRDLIILNSASIYPVDLLRLGINIDLDSFEYRNEIYMEAKSLYPTEPARQSMYLDLYTHMASVLDRNDRMTMGAGIECRVPFMDYRLMEMIPAMHSDLLLKGKKGKYLLFNSVAQKLPKEILSFKKLGFSVPWENYFNNDVYFQEFILNFEKDESMKIFPNLNLSKLALGFQQKNEVSITLIRHLFMVKSWFDTFMIK